MSDIPTDVAKVHRWVLHLLDQLKGSDDRPKLQSMKIIIDVNATDLPSVVVQRLARDDDGVLLLDRHENPILETDTYIFVNFDIDGHAILKLLPKES